MNRFISENQLDEQRKKRQEEWEKVRKADDPIDVPEEEYDPRSLYDRLQEQKDKKQEEFEEKLKFKNQFRGIDQDEASFLDNVASHLAKMEKQRNEDVNKEIADFKISFCVQGSNKNI
ncbi:unnamed protein product [Clavelina lepadiformis]|uniref:FAM192A/Fyv6 N-terminal domain-containing protein n=1 Tax=Clavelina lepadiformis TaxID=159417 RepID=A0ABP0G044_CLALP